MDMLTLLEKLQKFAGEPAQKAGDQVRGSESAKPAKKDQHPVTNRLVGETEDPSILKDLSQVAEEKQLEWKLAEAYAQFLEDNLGVEPKRPYRKGSRADAVGPRGHKNVPRYKNIKEYGATANRTPTTTAGTTDLKKAMAATTQLKAVTGTKAPADKLMKALDSASQGKQVTSQDMQVLEPMMDIIATTATDPNLANQFKSVAQQAQKKLQQKPNN